MGEELFADDVSARLAEFVRLELLHADGEPLDPDEPLVSSGRFDSFALAQVAVFIEETFGVYVPDTELTLENMNTIRAMSETVVRLGRR